MWFKLRFLSKWLNFEINDNKNLYYDFFDPFFHKIKWLLNFFCKTFKPFCMYKGSFIIGSIVCFNLGNWSLLSSLISHFCDLHVFVFRVFYFYWTTNKYLISQNGLFNRTKGIYEIMTMIQWFVTWINVTCYARRAFVKFLICRNLWSVKTLFSP
jgi:hypothetical protein